MSRGRNTVIISDKWRWTFVTESLEVRSFTPSVHSRSVKTKAAWCESKLKTGTVVLIVVKVN